MTTLTDVPQTSVLEPSSALVPSLVSAPTSQTVPSDPLEASKQALLGFLRTDGGIVARVEDTIAYTSWKSNVQLAAKEWAEAAYWRLISDKKIQRNKFDFVSLS